MYVLLRQELLHSEHWTRSQGAPEIRAFNFRVCVGMMVSMTPTLRGSLPSVTAAAQKR